MAGIADTEEIGMDPGGPVFYAIRHTRAHELFREGVATKLIQLQLGHA